ncbi:alcohol dehydrogenase catalytic domain-containing protein [Streptomyces sp. NBC_00513]|uniref:zinc-dependent alcohol dehydrogenase n=1 Tax=unclassified Streptomyces TaxID=2593676 RepID=UPI00225495E3|nr:alcohol dehydrogenase catalytic domain-containing protein [Streptomyces sp. NBC_00424]MCX5071235.1 alcohol dehydrogenase catalytic domain-containing protein [Streptomyces sp. NBC_00424]WUD45348.1 alcohol dehydrogenase catalytic domain-containing protein [Streptomyces sp. NBC_00513]
MDLVDVEEPILRAPTDVKVRIAMTGICGTDHKILAGKLDVAESGTILGHEGVGTVVEVGDAVRHLKIGDRVIINPTQSCGTCRNCRLGAYCYCFTFDDHQVGFTLAGTFAEYFVGSAQYLYPIPEGMSWQVASLIEPLGCSLNSVLKSNLQPHESVLVIGSGAIGLLCQSITRRLSRLTVATEPNAFRRDFAERFAHHALHPDELTPERIAELTDGKKFDVVIDAVGNQLTAAMLAVARGGRVVPMGYDDTYRVEIAPTRLIDDGLSIIAAVPLHDAIGPAIDFAADLPDLARMVTTEVDMEDFRSAFEATMGDNPETGLKVEVTSVKAVIRS